MRRKENVSSTLPRTKIGYSKESNDQRDQKRIRFTSNPCEDELLVVGLFPARFAHARYGSRMIDRFLNWGDHGKPKSGRIKGRCQPPPPLLKYIARFITYSSRRWADTWLPSISPKECTEGRSTLTSQPNFLGWIVYQIFLPMVLRWRAIRARELC